PPLPPARPARGWSRGRRAGSRPPGRRARPPTALVRPQCSRRSLSAARVNGGRTPAGPHVSGAGRFPGPRVTARHPGQPPGRPAGTDRRDVGSGQGAVHPRLGGASPGGLNLPRMPAAVPRPSLARRAVRRARRELSGLRRTTVRGSDPARVKPRWLRGHRLRVVLPDAAALVRLAGSGRLTGQIRALDLTLAHAPEWQVAGVRPPRLARSVTGFRWHRRGDRLRVRLRWSRPYESDRALGDAVRAVLRYRPWERARGPHPPETRSVAALG